MLIKITNIYRKLSGKTLLLLFENNEIMIQKRKTEFLHLIKPQGPIQIDLKLIGTVSVFPYNH